MASPLFPKFIWSPLNGTYKHRHAYNCMGNLHLPPTLQCNILNSWFCFQKKSIFCKTYLFLPSLKKKKNKTFSSLKLPIQMCKETVLTLSLSFQDSLPFIVFLHLSATFCKEQNWSPKSTVGPGIYLVYACAFIFLNGYCTPHGELYFRILDMFIALYNCVTIVKKKSFSLERKVKGNCIPMIFNVIFHRVLNLFLPVLMHFYCKCRFYQIPLISAFVLDLPNILLKPQMYYLHYIIYMSTNTDTVQQGLPIKFLFYSHVCLGWNSNTTNLVYLVCHAVICHYPLIICRA